MILILLLQNLTSRGLKHGSRTFYRTTFRRRTFHRQTFRRKNILPLGNFAAWTFRRWTLCHIVILLHEQIIIYLWSCLFEQPSFCCWPRYIHCLIPLIHRFFLTIFYILHERIKYGVTWSSWLTKSDTFTNTWPTLTSVVVPGQESVQRSRWPWLVSK